MFARRRHRWVQKPEGKNDHPSRPVLRPPSSSPVNSSCRMGENCLIEGRIESNPEGCDFSSFSALFDLINVPPRHILFPGRTFNASPYGQRTHHAVFACTSRVGLSARAGTLSRALPCPSQPLNGAIFQQHARHLGAGLHFAAIRRDHARRDRCRASSIRL